MRILQVINTLTLAGAERLVFDLVPRLSDRGLDLSLLVLQSLDTPLENDLRVRGVPFLPTGKGGIYSSRQVPHFAKTIAGFDLVHVHLFPAQLWMSAASLFMGERPALVTTEHNPTNLRRHWWFRPVDRWLYPRYDRIICNSQATLAALVDWVPAIRERVTVIANGIDLSRFHHVPAARPPGMPLTLTFIARLEPQKDHEMLFRALTAVPGVELQLVGVGPKQATLKALAADLGIAERVRFLGHRNDIPELLTSTDLYVHCAHSEGFGIAAAEAMAAGLPVVATSNEGMAQVIGDAGVLVPPGEHVRLAQEIQRLAADPQERCRLGSAARQRAQAFGIDATADAHVRTYQEVLAARTPR